MRPILVVAAGRTRRRQVGVAAPVLAAVVVALTACGQADQETSAVAVDCAQQVRLDGVVYTGFGLEGRPATRLGTADLAECDDMGVDPAGSVFPDDPEKVAVWSVRGHPTDEVVAVRWDSDRVQVFVAESLSGPDREQVLRELRRDAR